MDACGGSSCLIRGSSRWGWADAYDHLVDAGPEEVVRGHGSGLRFSQFLLQVLYFPGVPAPSKGLRIKWSCGSWGFCRTDFLGAVLERAEGREKTFSEEGIEEKKNPWPGTRGFGTPARRQVVITVTGIRRSDGHPERCDAACRRSHRSCRCRRHHRQRCACSDRVRRSDRYRSRCSCRLADRGARS